MDITLYAPATVDGTTRALATLVLPGLAFVAGRMAASRLATKVLTRATRRRATPLQATHTLTNTHRQLLDAPAHSIGDLRHEGRGSASTGVYAAESVRTGGGQMGRALLRRPRSSESRRNHGAAS